MPENRTAMDDDLYSTVIREHSHSLANLLRDRARVLRRQFQSDAATQFEKAADLIDPEVSGDV